MASIASECRSLPSHNSDGLFSLLPDDVLLQILSFLTLRQRTIGSRVSKKWRHMMTSLDDGKFVKTHSPNIYCENCYGRKCRNCSLIRHVIKLGGDNNFTEFYLICRTFFKLSPAILESRLLTVLHLVHCTLDEENFGDIKELPLLKEIYFDRVRISPITFYMLINNSPSMVELTLKYCFNLDSIIVPPHLNELKKVHVSFPCSAHAIQIGARNLREFHLFSSSPSPLELDLRACTKLQVLEIDCVYIPVGFPEEFFSAFPHLKSLFLRLCRRLNKIKLLSPELENLTLRNMIDLHDATIVTPNLRSLKLIDTIKTKVPSWSPVVIGSRLTEVEIGRLTEGEIGLKYVCATNRLPDLRTFAENLTFSLDTTATESKDVKFHSSKHWSYIQPLYIKHINLVIYHPWPDPPRYELFIDELFGYFHPRTLMVRVHSYALMYDFIQVLLDELKGQKRECSKRYKCSNNTSWRHFLNGFKILESTTIQPANQITLEFQWEGVSSKQQAIALRCPHLFSIKYSRRGKALSEASQSEKEGFSSFKNLS